MLFTVLWKKKNLYNGEQNTRIFFLNTYRRKRMKFNLIFNVIERGLQYQRCRGVSLKTQVPDSMGRHTETQDMPVLKSMTLNIHLGSPQNRRADLCHVE